MIIVEHCSKRDMSMQYLRLCVCIHIFHFVFLVLTLAAFSAHSFSVHFVRFSLTFSTFVIFVPFSRSLPFTLSLTVLLFLSHSFLVLRFTIFYSLKFLYFFFFTLFLPHSVCFSQSLFLTLFLSIYSIFSYSHLSHSIFPHFIFYEFQSHGHDPHHLISDGNEEEGRVMCVE